MSNLASLLRQGEFVVTAELNPPKSASGEAVKRRAGALKGSVDAVNVTDSNRSVAAMAAIPAAVLVREAGVEPIVQITGRDRNRIALQADLLGAAALGLPNFLFMSGDDPKHGNHPDAVYVKDLDGVALVKMAVTMRDEHKFLSGDEIRQAPDYFIGATASPFTKPMSADLDRTVEKVNSGADFLQTQPVFDLATFSQWLAELRRVGGGREAAVIAGVLILRSAEQAERLARVPGVALGEEVIDRIKKAADGEQEGITIAVEMVKSLRALPGVRGVHLYAIEWPEAVPLVAERAGLLPRPKVKESNP
ncbi:MAG TPA: methylenetetrahydrofolate reductase [Candidatus Limnocylindria bacterium]|nr:methylenetetrahydrofolate reductase [Candidatus Limnocylindria bacterium]